MHICAEIAPQCTNQEGATPASWVQEPPSTFISNSIKNEVYQFGRRIEFAERLTGISVKIPLV